MKTPVSAARSRRQVLAGAVAAFVSAGLPAASTANAHLDLSADDRLAVNVLPGGARG